jgi:hypothetical protein
MLRVVILLSLIVTSLSYCVTYDFVEPHELKFTNKSQISVCYLTSGRQLSASEISYFIKQDIEPNNLYSAYCIEPDNSIFLPGSRSSYPEEMTYYLYIYNKTQVFSMRKNKVVNISDMIKTYKFSKSDLDTMDWHLVYDGK